MQDKEKVIKGLETCSDVYYGADGACSSCPYSKINGDMCVAELVYDAIALLKEQEAVEPILEQDSMVCGVCGHEVIWQKMLGDGIWSDEKLDFCPHCGRKVKWDENP